MHKIYTTICSLIGVTLNVQLLPLVYIVLGTLGQTTRVHWQCSTSANGYGTIAETAITLIHILEYNIYYNNAILLEIAVILEKAQQMLAQRLFIERLIRLDGLNEIQVKAILLPQVKLLWI